MECGAVRVRTRELRRRCQLSQGELAARAGIRRGTVSALERGHSHGIQFDTLFRLCTALQCQPGDLLELVEEEPALVLGGPDEDAILRERLANPGRRVDGPSFLQALIEQEQRPVRP